jgi:glycosyltransferase involved in cell wall biosynthesis/peptidoglycan/xylan/chitin deacetylase (PgdA/CDA1 family)
MQGTRLSDNRSTEPEAPSISIVVPTYQRRDLVRDVVHSIGAMDYAGSIEVIVVVDGSTDGTAAALAGLASRWPLRVLEQDNQGAAAARNRGAEVASNDILLFLDDDMIADPALATEHARLHCAGAEAVIGDTPIDRNSPAGFLPESVARWIASTSLSTPLSPFDIFSGQLSVRRSLFAELGGFDCGFTTAEAFGHEDTDFGVRLLDGHDVRYNPRAISRQRYVVTPREYMDRGLQSVAADLRFVRKHPDLARELFERKGASLPLTRMLYLPLARIPLLPEMLAGLAIRLADGAMTTRLRSSRIIARIFSGARTLGYWAALRRNGWLPFSDQVLVLCYHAIQDQSDDPVLARYGVPPRLFADHLALLGRSGYRFITPDHFAAFLDSGAPLPRRPVLLTFDDGFADLVDLARDVLRPGGIGALAFVVTGPESGTNEWDQAYGARPVRLLSAGERTTLASLGVEIGSHSRSHAEMPLLDASVQASEAVASADTLAAQGLPRPRFFAYPFGSLDQVSKQAVQDAGYDAAFGCRAGRASRVSDRFDLPRVIVLATDRGWRFRLKVAAPRLFAFVALQVARVRRIVRGARVNH